MKPASPQPWPPGKWLAALLVFGLLPAALSALPEPANPRLPSLLLIGDSTVRNGAGRGDGGQWGWGDFLAPFFDTNRINIVNRALGGASSRTYYRDQWPRTLALLKPGDFLIMQFGHNDDGRIGDPVNKQRADGKGIGDETVADTCSAGPPELVHTFGWYMARFVVEARAHGATAIICSPIPHKQHWETGRDFANVADWDEQVARNHGAFYFDLTRVITEAYKIIGKEKADGFFADRGTHTTASGAQFNAACVSVGLKSLPGDPLGNYFSDPGRAGEHWPAASAGGKFDFSNGPPRAGWTHVAPTNFYSAETGYGFEPGVEVSRTDYVTSDRPFLFSVKLPESNYAVTAQLNDKTGESVTTVKAEQRRLMLEKVQIRPGRPAPRTFIVNVRTPRISATERVRLKQREVQTETMEWDDKLTLEFNGRRPTLRTLVIAPTNVPTVFLTGDSTVCDQPAEPWTSWGQMLPRFFQPCVAVANYAESGETIRSSLGAHRFDKVFSLMKPGDYLFVQFGHDDQKDKATNALAVYQANLEKIVARTRRLGGTPVLVTSMERKGGVEQSTLAGYPDAVREVAREERCALIDLNRMSRTFYRALGADLGKAFQDGTHHDNYGSYELAKCVVAGIRQDKLPLAKYIVDDFGDFDPAKPDAVATFEMPASPLAAKAPPLGN